MNPANQLRMLRRKQMTAQEGLALLRDIRQELWSDDRSARAWGNRAIMANVMLIPLNVIVNAFQLGAVKSVYEQVVREVYAGVAGSGTRADGHVATLLAVLKTSVVKALVSKGLKQYIPGANILLGLAEDSWAAFQIADLVTKGNPETSELIRRLDRQIARAQWQLVNLGIQEAQVQETAQRHDRTA